MGTDSEMKRANSKRRVLLKGFLFATTVGSTSTMLYHFQLRGKSVEESTLERSVTGNNPPKKPIPLEDFSHLDDCTVSFEPPPKKDVGEWKTKPLWFPAHPTSIEDAVHKNIINGITGLPAGGKSFYASSKAIKLRQCQGQTETATCMNVHPIVDMGKKHPDTRAHIFFGQYIMGLRNPMTVLPAFYNQKAIKYHGLCTGCQVPEDQWRQDRDAYLGDMVDTWKNLIKTWKTMTKYKRGMYLVHEHLLDAQKGPLELKRLASVLRDAGFVTAPDESIPCIWYKAIGKDSIEQFHQGGYEYKDYKPGYTKVQQEFLLSELSKFAEENKQDSELVAILKEYQENIKDNIRSDSAWTNQTMKQNQ